MSDIISPHFNYSEFVVSADYPELAAKIKLRGADWVKMHNIVWSILEPARIYIAHKFKILSGIRSAELNTAIGGSSISEHLFMNYSCACDFTVLHADLEPAQVLVYDVWYRLKETAQFGQLIYYGPEHGNFIHVSLPTRKNQSVVMKKITNGYLHIN